MATDLELWVNVEAGFQFENLKSLEPKYAKGLHSLIQEDTHVRGLSTPGESNY
jgi:hypothetical protein